MSKYFFILSLLLFPSGLAFAQLNPLLADMMKHEEVRVEEVLSSNNVLLDTGEKIRLIGLKEIEPPKMKKQERDKHGFIKKNDQGDPRLKLEDQVVRYLNDLVLGEKVSLKFDMQRRNPDGDLEAYIYLKDGRMVNELMLREGYADLQLRPPNMKYADVLRDAYREASQEQRGIQGQW